MASPKPKLSIHAARMSALSRCLGSIAPLTLLMDFEENLRNLGWSEASIKDVSRGVLPLLLIGTDGDKDGASDVSLGVG